MKRSTISSLILLSTAVLFAQNSHAQDFTRWGLPEGALLRLGKGYAHAVAWSPDGTRVAVAAHIGIWLYDATTGAEVNLLAGHTHRVYSVAFSPDGTTLATHRDPVRLWDVATGQGRTYSMRSCSVAFSPDGRLASAGHTTTRCGCGTWPQGRKNTSSQAVRRFGGVFARWDDAGKRQSGQYGAVVGRGHRAGKKHPHRTYAVRLFGGVFAGWDWQAPVGTVPCVVGRGHRAGKRHLHRTYRWGLFGGVLTAWDDAGKRR